MEAHALPAAEVQTKDLLRWRNNVGYKKVSSLGGSLKGGVAFADAHSAGVQTVEAREEGCIGRNGLTVGCYVLCSCNLDVMGSGSEVVGSKAQSLNGLGSLKRGGRVVEAVRPFGCGVGRKGKVGDAFGPSEVGFSGGVGWSLLVIQRLQKRSFSLGHKRTKMEKE